MQQSKTQDTDCLNGFHWMFKANRCHATELVCLFIHFEFNVQHVASNPKYLFKLLRCDFVVKLCNSKQQTLYDKEIDEISLKQKQRAKV